MKALLLAGTGTIALGSALFVLTSSQDPQNSAKIAEVQQQAKLQRQQANPDKDAFYGDLHLHTDQSFDAYTFGTRLGPKDAYRYAKGESIDYLGQPFKRDFPLDFLAVTDHSENLGVLLQLNDSTSLLAKSELGQQLKGGGGGIYPVIRKYFFQKDYSTFIPGFDNNAVVKSTWQKNIEAANSAYQPGKFTAFIAYEWTSAPDRKNLHRNVIFRTEKTTDRPFSSIDSNKPEDLWSFLESQRKLGNEALAIPHNPNASNGLMYDWNDSYGKPIDQEYAERRVLNEPINEISQNKGTSETHPALSPTDEFANFEISDFMSPRSDSTRGTEGSYVRNAYGRGLVIREKIGKDPFKFGIIGASDLHGAVSIGKESDYVGNIAAVPTDPNLALGHKKAGFGQSPIYGSGNLTGAWAEENTRESIYDALRRKETFATTGTKLKVRFFGGWDYNKDLIKDQAWVKAAYSKGVPMGGDLPSKPAQKKAPSFVVWALKDPNNANLDRIQIVKVWAIGGKHSEKVFDVALADGRKPDAKTGKVAPVGNTVDLKTATYQNTIGDTELSAVWTDPEFDASVPAVYYVRVLEIPTPRWTTYLAVKHNLPLAKNVAATIQERAWTSPIWYTPTK